MVSRKRIVIATFVSMAVGYIILPIHLGLSTRQTDIVFSVLLTLALCILAYEDHRTIKEPKPLLAAILPVCLLVLAVTLLVLLNGLPFAALIPLIVICGGVLYWYIDRCVPSATE